jgi:quinol monooxygenase YgiN
LVVLLASGQADALSSCYIGVGDNVADLLTETMKQRLSSVTRSYDGCEYVHLYADPDDASHLFLLERWESRAKYEKYREWAMAQPGSTEMMAQVERDPTWMYRDDTGA